MRVKYDEVETGGAPEGFSILDEFDSMADTATHFPLTVTNRGKEITLHIMPADYSDKIHHQYAMQQALLASLNVKDALLAARDDAIMDVAVDAIKSLNFELEGAAHMQFAYGLLAKNVREVAELTHEQLASRGFSKREDFVRRFLDALATETVYNAIMDLGRAKADKTADKVLDIADTVKN